MENEKLIYNWSYVPDEKYRTNDNLSQLDWNYSLITTINKAYATYRNNFERRIKESKLIIPCKIMGLFYMMDYYDHKNNTLSHRYEIEVIHEDINYIECVGINSIIVIDNLYEKWNYI